MRHENFDRRQFFLSWVNRVSGCVMHYYRCRTAKVMYVEDQLLNLKGGATYLCNNLDVVNSKEETTGEQINVYTVVHKAEVELVYSEVNGGGVSHTQRVSCRSDHKEETVIITQVNASNVIFGPVHAVSRLP